MVQGTISLSYRPERATKGSATDLDDVELFELKQEVTHERKKLPVRWRDLPQRGQLLILGLCRLVDFLQVASFQTFMFYQLKSFNHALPDATISWQAGVLQGGFTAAQFITAIPWGRAADASWCGRKNVILVGLLSTAGSCLGLAFSTSFLQAMLWRVFGGAMNGTVGIIRTMVSENVKERKYQSRAFLILPLSFNIAAFLGPVLGGYLSGIGSSSEKVSGDSQLAYFEFPRAFPYALPSLANGLILTSAAAVVFLGLEETLESRKYQFDYGISLGWWLTKHGNGYSPIPLSFRGEGEGGEGCGFLDDTTEREEDLLSTERGPSSSRSSDEITYRALSKPRLPFRRIFTRNVLWTLVAEAFFDFHLGAFASIWPLFLSSPAAHRDTTSRAETTWDRKSPFRFAGGLGMQVRTVGIGMAMLGVMGTILQLAIYPKVHSRFGTVRCYQLFATVFPVAYVATPFLILLPPGALLWVGLTLASLIFMVARTFTLPSTIVLLNSCSPHPSVLGTVHGIGQSVSAAFRTIGPIIGGQWFSLGTVNGNASTSWWAVAVVAAFGWIASCFVREGNGHEIILEGDDD